MLSIHSRCGRGVATSCRTPRTQKSTLVISGAKISAVNHLCHLQPGPNYTHLKQPSQSGPPICHIPLWNLEWYLWAVHCHHFSRRLVEPRALLLWKHMDLLPQFIFLPFFLMLKQRPMENLPSILTLHGSWVMKNFAEVKKKATTDEKGDDTINNTS